MRLGLLALGSAVGCVVLACSSATYVGGGLPGDAGAGNGGVGTPCSNDNVCRTPLACVNGACGPSHGVADGSPCTLNDDCMAGEYCGPARKCTKGGSGNDGDPCTSDGDCKTGDRCDIVGFSAECLPEGTADIGGACKSSNDCLGGLACANNMCEPLPPNPTGPVPLGIPSYAGETCVADSGPTTAYFHVPRFAGADGDFYRLPFPNDIRMKAGHPDYTNHPTPGSSLLGFDPVDRYLRDVEQSADGFSAYPTVYFRFSAGVDFNSLKGTGVVRMIDVTPAGSGADLGYYWSATTARNKYICENNFTLRPPEGAPLAPGHTYAVFITTAATSMGVPVGRGEDMAAMLGSTAPTDSTLAAAYPTYKPLRDWATTAKFDLNSILTAAVFTVGHVNALATKLGAAVTAAPAPTATGWIRCGDAPSPCPQAMAERACPTTPDPTFDELHALVTLPIFQKGTEPYLDPTDGGDLEIQMDGTPKLQTSEQVCMSLTVPKGTAMPAAGWPVVIYAPGTGGSFRSVVNDGVAARLTSVDDGSGGQVHMAVLGIDQVEHGTRRGMSTKSPNDLFYNFANPAAARGNPMQGAIDQLSLLRFVQSFDLLSTASPTMAEIKLGPVAFWGHSQGATEDAIALPYASGVAGVVVSGEGASLMDALLTKKNPVNIAAAFPFVVQDPSVDIYHPVLSVLQNDIDPADPLNHAAAMAAIPFTPGLSKNVFQPFAQLDTYSPPVTQVTYVLAGGLAVVQPPSSVSTPDADLTKLMPQAAPFGGNVTDKGKPITAVVREYAPVSYDGHFVAFKDADGIKDVNHFLADVCRGVVPKVGR